MTEDCIQTARMLHSCSPAPDWLVIAFLLLFGGAYLWSKRHLP
jgi:hypothetical protein